MEAAAHPPNQVSWAWKILGIHLPYDTPERFATSYLWGPLTNGLIRLVFAVYTLTTLIIGLVSSIIEDRPWLWPIYFTNLTYLGLTLYFLLSTINSLVFWRYGVALVSLRCPRIIRILYYALHNSVLTFSFLVTIIYWTMVIGPEFEDAIRMKKNLKIFYGISVHVLNVAFVLVELLFLQTTLPSPLMYLVTTIFLLLLYCGLFFMAAGLGQPAYAQLDPRKNGAGWIALKALLIAAVCIVIFFVIWGFVILRTWFWEKRRGRSVPASRLNEQAGSTEATSQEK